jgi:hypothetical protein
MRQLKFPTYEYIKSLPTYDKETGLYPEYNWSLFETPTDVYGRLTWNVDDEGYIYFDVMEDGYCDHNTLGLTVIFNKDNYKKLCKHAQAVFESFYTALDRDCSVDWEDYIIK